MSSVLCGECDIALKMYQFVLLRMLLPLDIRRVLGLQVYQVIHSAPSPPTDGVIALRKQAQARVRPHTSENDCLASLNPVPQHRPNQHVRPD